MNKPILNKRAFTLMELVIVISIISILGMALFPSVNSYLKRSRNVTRIMDLKKLGNAIDAYIIDKDHFPRNQLENGYNCLAPPPSTTFYFSKTINGPTCTVTIAPIATLSSQTGGLVEGGYLGVLPTDPGGGGHYNGCILPSMYCYSYNTGSIYYYALSATLEGGNNTGNIPAFNMTILPTMTQFTQWSNAVKGSGSGYVLTKRIN